MAPKGVSTMLDQSISTRAFSPCPAHAQDGAGLNQLAYDAWNAQRSHNDADTKRQGREAARSAALSIRDMLMACESCREQSRANALALIRSGAIRLPSSDMTPAMLCKRFKWRFEMGPGYPWAQALRQWCAAAAQWHHALSCDCLQCVTDRITEDRKSA